MPKTKSLSSIIAINRHYQGLAKPRPRPPTKFARALLFTSIFSLFFTLINLSFSGYSAAEVDKDILGSGPGRFNSIVAEDIDDDGRCEIVFGNYDGFVTVLEYSDYDFHEEWHSPKIGHRVWGVIVADFIGDDSLEIIAGNGDGEIYVYDGSSHKELWYAEDLVRDVHGLAVHDLGTSGGRYLLAGTGYKNDKDLGTIYIFTANSTEPVAKIADIDNRLRGLGVGDVDGDGELEIVFGSGNATGENPGEGYIRVYDVNKVLNNEPGALEWHSPDLKGDCVSLELIDVTGDGFPDIITGNGYRYQAGWVRVLTYDKPTREYIEYWKSPDIGPKPYGLAVGDVDLDDKLEIVVGNQPGYIYIYEQTAGGFAEEWRSKLLGSDILGLDVADVDNDNDLEIIAAQGGYIGKGDYTSAYTEPHIYIIDGLTHEIEIIIGETHPLGFILQLVILVLVILFLGGLNYYLRYRKRVKAYLESQATTPEQKTPIPPGQPKTPGTVVSAPTAAIDPTSATDPTASTPHSHTQTPKPTNSQTQLAKPTIPEGVAVFDPFGRED